MGGFLDFSYERIMNNKEQNEILDKRALVKNCIYVEIKNIYKMKSLQEKGEIFRQFGDCEI